MNETLNQAPERASSAALGSEQTTSSQRACAAHATERTRPASGSRRPLSRRDLMAVLH